MSATLTAQEIDSASTKTLQDMTTKMTGAPCTNRNAKAMRARLHKMIAVSLPAPDKAIVSVIENKPLDTESPETAKGKPASPFGNGPSEPQTGKPARVKKEKPAKVPAKKEKVAKPEAEKPAAPAKKARAARAEKVVADKPALVKKEKPALVKKEKPARAVKPARVKKEKAPKKERADKGIDRKPACAPRPANPDRLHTKATLADLPIDVILVHKFRGGESVRVRVAEAPAKDGSGGVFFYKNKKYLGLKGLRDIVFETSGIAWNVLMYFRREDTGELLQPYPQHAKKEVVAAA